MRFLASRRWRIFLITWMVFAVHFATNVVREHYPAFTLAEHGTFQVDEYQGFHSDIFVHRDGHSYVGNNVIVSVLAAVPLFVFDPLLDAIERYSKAKLDASGTPPDGAYRTDKPMRREFFKLVTERGLELRFGAATVITSAFFMAPFSALIVVLMFSVLRARGVMVERATWLAFLFAFGTPVLFRTAVLNHNLFLMYALLLAFVLLWQPAGGPSPAPRRNRVGAGFLGGFTLAVDYIGILSLMALYGYLVLSRLRTASITKSFKESILFVAGSVPPVLFLLYSQWAMYGHPLYPGQFWMPNQNIYVEVGVRGFDWPSPDLFFLNLFDPSYGMFTFGPLLILGLLPVIGRRDEDLVLPRRERLFVILIFIAFMVFCAANQYSRLQFNTGFRYLVPLVPLFFLAASDHLNHLSRRLLAVITVVVVVHSWVLTVFRESVPRSWSMFFNEGVQLPWLRVLKMTSSPDAAIVQNPLLPTVLLGITVLVALGVWWYGASLEAEGRAAREAPSS
jgi:hypothetical protein